MTETERRINIERLTKVEKAIKAHIKEEISNKEEFMEFVRGLMLERILKGKILLSDVDSNGKTKNPDALLKLLDEADLLYLVIKQYIEIYRR